MYRTYSYNDMPIPVKRKPDYKPKPTATPTPHCEEHKEDKKDGILNGLFDKIETDDIILLIVVLVLLLDDCDDKLLLLAIGFVFISEWI